MNEEIIKPRHPLLFLTGYMAKEVSLFFVPILLVAFIVSLLIGQKLHNAEVEKINILKAQTENYLNLSVKLNEYGLGSDSPKTVKRVLDDLVDNNPDEAKKIFYQMVDMYEHIDSLENVMKTLEEMK